MSDQVLLLPESFLKPCHCPRCGDTNLLYQETDFADCYRYDLIECLSCDFVGYEVSKEIFDTFLDEEFNQI